MIKSMTAFARETQSGDLGELVWELRSVNHRFLEPHIRLPEELRALETAVRERLAARLQRGKVDCGLRHAPAVGAVGSLRVNQPYVKQLIAAATEVGHLVGQLSHPDPLELLRWPGALVEQERDLDAVSAAALTLLDRAIDTLLATREREGERLAVLLRDRCDRLQESVARVRARMPQVMEGVRRRLADRLVELKAELDPLRIEQEIALVAARLDVDEEMDRLEAHVAEVRDVLRRNEPVGRRLDFLMQELNREANTLGSKSADVETTREAVEMKVLIEQMREQIQNLE
ncbi:MAG: YicC/YloC family endoribonuclease [Bdellovibrio bacteriovorus]